MFTNTLFLFPMENTSTCLTVHIRECYKEDQQVRWIIIQYFKVNSWQDLERREQKRGPEGRVVLSNFNKDELNEIYGYLKDIIGTKESEKKYEKCKLRCRM